MIVNIGEGTVGVTEPDDCRRLHVQTVSSVDVDAALRATGSGRLAEGGDALIDVQVLHSLARAGATSASWERDWAAMIDYADSKGWLTPDRGSVVAHVETA